MLDDDTQEPRERYRSLDGLRGVAALIVLIHHSLGLSPTLRQPDSTGEAVNFDHHPVAWVLVHTPIHALWAGSEAVFIFFVLSGVVLTLPVLQNPRFSWTAYYPRRIVRLYAPVIVAVILAGILFTELTVTPPSGISTWAISHRILPTAGGLLHDFTLIFGISGVLGVLWSLRWEVWFSLLLPVVVWAVRWWPRGFWVKTLAALAVIAVGTQVSSRPELFYMPMFAVGALLASRLPHARAFISSRGPRSPLLASAFALAVLMFVSFWLTLPLDLPQRVQRLTYVAVVVGAAGLVTLAAFWDPIREVLLLGPIQWLGRVSYSLYLVHLPIVIAMGYLLGSYGWHVATVAALIVAPIVAWFFYRFVEAPSHRLSRKVPALPGRTLDRVSR